MIEGSDIKRKNLDALTRHGQGELSATLSGIAVSGGVEVRTAKNGDPTLLVADRALHSLYDPRKEAKTLAEKLLKDVNPSNPLIFLGSGLGYMIESLPERFEHTEVLIAEYDPEIVAIAMESRDMSAVIQRSRWVVEKGSPELAKATMERLGDASKEATVIVMPALREINPEAIEQFEKTFNPDTSSGSDQKHSVMVVGPVYGGSLPIAGYVTNALKKLGHRVDWMDFSPLYESVKFFSGAVRDDHHGKVLQGQYTHLMSQVILARVMEKKPQIVFFMAQSPATPELLSELRKMGVASAFWFVEDGELFEYGVRMAPHYDVFFHIQKGNYEQKLREAGARHVHYLPLAADPEIHRPVNLSPEERERYGSDLSHVGAGYYNRRHFFPLLAGYDFKLWGSDWDNPGVLAKVLQNDGARVSTEDSVKIFNATKININLHSATHVPGVNPQGDFVNPRTFELACCGAFQLTDERSLLSELFTPGEEIVTFRDFADCRAKIDYYLANPEEAARIAEKSRQRALKDHTYEKRMEEALTVIKSICRLPEYSAETNTVRSLVAEAGDDRELADFFNGLGEPDDEVTLEKIGERIRHGEGTMSRTEAVFLLMDEFNRWAVEKGVA